MLHMQTRPCVDMSLLCQYMCLIWTHWYQQYDLYTYGLMHVCLHTFTKTHTHTHIYIYIYIYIYICMECTYIHTFHIYTLYTCLSHINTYTNTCTHMHSSCLPTYIHIHVCIHTYNYTDYIYIYIYMHAYIHTHCICTSIPTWKHVCIIMLPSWVNNATYILNEKLKFTYLCYQVTMPCKTTMTTTTTTQKYDPLTASTCSVSVWHVTSSQLI